MKYDADADATPLDVPGHNDDFRCFIFLMPMLSTAF